MKISKALLSILFKWHTQAETKLGNANRLIYQPTDGQWESEKWVGVAQ